MTRTSSRPAANRPNQRRALAALLALAMVLVSLPPMGLSQTDVPSPTVDWVTDRPGNGRSAWDVTPVLGAEGPGVGLVYNDRVEVREADGSLRWATPADQDGLVVESGDLTGDGTHDVIAGTGSVLDPPSRVNAYDGRTGDRLWSVEAGGSQTNALLADPPANPDRVVTAASDGPAEGTVTARDPGTGASRWTHTTAEPPTTVVRAGQHVVVGTRDGVVDRLDPETGQQAVTTDLGEDAFVRDLEPLPDGSLIAAARTHVAHVDPDGSIAWTYQDGDDQFGSVDVADTDGDGRLEAFVLANDGDHVHALDAQDGTIAWREGEAGWRTSRTFHQTSNIQVVERDAGPIVVAGGVPGELRAYDPATGDEVWSLASPGPTEQLAVLEAGADARVVMPHQYAHLFGVEADGTLAWKFDLAPVQAGTTADFDGDGVPDPATITNGYVYVHDGTTGEQLLEHEVYPLLPDAVGTNIEVADVTGDDHPDVVATIRNHFVDGVALAIDGATGERLWTFRTALIGGFFQSGLLLEDVTGDGMPDALFVGDRGHPTYAHAVNGTNGELIWEYHVEDSVLAIALAEPPVGPPVLGIVRDHTTCACHAAPALVGLDATTGRELFEQTIDSRPRALVGIENDNGLARFALPEISAGRGLLPTSPLGEPTERIVVRDALTGLPTRTIDVTERGTMNTRLGNQLRAADVDGEGGDEILFTLFQGGRRSQGGAAVGAVHPESGDKLWTTPFRPGGISELEAGPARQGSGADVAAHWGGDEDTFALLASEDGTPRWEHDTQESPVRFIDAETTNQAETRAVVAEGTRLVGLGPPFG